MWLFRGKKMFERNMKKENSTKSDKNRGQIIKVSKRKTQSTNLLQQILKRCSCTYELKNTIYEGYYYIPWALEAATLKKTSDVNIQSNIFKIKDERIVVKTPNNLETTATKTSEPINEYDVYETWLPNQNSNSVASLSSYLCKQKSMLKNQSKTSNRSLFKIKRIVLKNENDQFEEKSTVVQLLNEQLASKALPSKFI